MGERPVLTARLSDRTLERLEDYADREGMSKSKAADNMIRQGLDVEESDMRLVPVRSDGGTVIEDRLDEIERKQSQKFNEIGDKIDEQPEYTVIQNIELLLAGLFGFSGAAIGVIGILSYANLGISPLPPVYVSVVVLFSIICVGLSEHVRRQHD